MFIDLCIYYARADCILLKPFELLLVSGLQITQISQNKENLQHISIYETCVAQMTNVSQRNGKL